MPVLLDEEIDRVPEVASGIVPTPADLMNERLHSHGREV
jgi:hypothetical protein